MQCPSCDGLVSMQIVEDLDDRDVWECPACGYTEYRTPESVNYSAKYVCDCGRMFSDYVDLNRCQETNHGIVKAEAENDEPSCIRLEPVNNNGPDGSPSSYKVLHSHYRVVLGEFCIECDGSWMFYPITGAGAAWSWPVLKAIATELEHLDRAAAEEMGTPF